MFLFFFYVANILWTLIADIRCGQSKARKLNISHQPAKRDNAGPKATGGVLKAALLEPRSERIQGQQSIVSAVLSRPLFRVGRVVFCCCCCFNGTFWNRPCICQGEANAHAITQHFLLPWKERGCFYILGEVFLVLLGFIHPTGRSAWGAKCSVMWLVSHSSIPVLCLRYYTQISIIWQICKRFFSCVIIIVTSYITFPFRCGWDFCLFAWTW